MIRGRLATQKFQAAPTVICLNKRAADDLINFQAVAKNRLRYYQLFRANYGTVIQY